MKKRKMVCSECGSEKVMRDSWAVWDFAKQEWALYNVFDDAWCAYRDWETDRKSTRLNSSHITRSRMPSSA